VNEIHTWINARVASHKRLRGGIIVVEGIPKSPTGKILRRELKDWFLKNRLQEKL
jgi:acyl-coenzyme A synthetase/AMP-(fatty) acid ligase